MDRKIEKTDRPAYRWMDRQGKGRFYSVFYNISCPLFPCIAVFLSSFPSSLLPSLSSLLTISVYVSMSVCVCVCVSTSLMFLACQCNGASVVSRACCSWIALCKPVLLDRQVQLGCMYSGCRFLFVCLQAHVHMGVFFMHSLNHVCTWVHLFKVCTSDCFSESAREEVEGLACCCSSVGYL